MAERTDNPSQQELRRAYDFVRTLKYGLTQARRTGGANAKMHVGDVLGLIEAFERGDLDAGTSPEKAVEGPFFYTSAPKVQS